MTAYSVAEAKNRLSELIDRALKGEGVVITRYGSPVAEIRAAAQSPRPVSAEDLEWLDRLRYRPKKRFREDASALISRLRDESGH